MNKEKVNVYIVKSMINLKDASFTRLWYKRTSYIERKYGINKYNAKIDDKYGINENWKRIIDNYLLKRKIRVKLKENGVIEKRNKL